MDARGGNRARNCLGKYVEAGIIAALRAFNAALGSFQEGRAQATLAALKSRLALNASVKRNNACSTAAAAELVVRDIVKLWLGAVVAADMRLAGGSDSSGRVARLDRAS
jgi:H+-transporting ATPase